MEVGNIKLLGRAPRTVWLTVVIVAVAAIGARALYASFISTATDTQQISTGTVTIGSNDTGSALFSLADMKPADSPVSQCITVTMTGSRDSTVHLYGSLSGTLDPYVNLVVTRGTDSSPSFASCTNFTADTTDYNGDGDGVVYSGLLSNYPTTYAGGIIDPKSATPETWSHNEAHSYQFTVSLANNPLAQGLTSSPTFTWEARNL